MEKCYTCATYNEKYNEMCQEMDDIKETICYHCIMYDDVIPPKIANDKDVCPFYYQKG